MAVPPREVRLAVDTRQEVRPELAQVPYREERDIGESVFHCRLGLVNMVRRCLLRTAAASVQEGEGLCNWSKHYAAWTMLLQTHGA